MVINLTVQSNQSVDLDSRFDESNKELQSKVDDTEVHPQLEISGHFPSQLWAYLVNCRSEMSAKDGKFLLGHFVGHAELWETRNGHLTPNLPWNSNLSTSQIP